MNETLQTKAPMIFKVSRGGKTILETAVATVNQASAIWCRYRDAEGFGGSDAPRARIYVDGIARAHVAYNGRVFVGATWKSGAVVLCEAQS